MKFNKDQVLGAIEDSGGLITVISKKLGCKWHTAKLYVNKWKTTKEFIEYEIEKTKDKAENIIIKALNEGDLQTAKWYLQTIGKDRGFADKQEIEHNISGKIDNKIEVILVKNENRNT